jgi:UDP-N-acetylmuramate--alanine ligase
MINIDHIKYVYLIGIGGIGMSGLARYFKNQGLSVGGYDRTETELTKQLVQEGISVIYEDNDALIPEEVREVSSEILIIYTPAIPNDSKILNFFKEKGHLLHKRAEVLGLLSKSQYTIAVAGTHGKTTTSCMIAHILTDSGLHCSAFLGGIASNYNTNMLISDSNLLVVEADEYDRSFLTLHPDIAIVTATDADHLDIYDSRDQLVESFKLFINQITEKGVRIIRKGLSLHSDITYAQGESADAYSSESRIVNGEFYFDYYHDDFIIQDIHLGIPGNHNIENAVAAITAARLVGVSAEQIKKALSNFKGVKRRFEYIVKNAENIYIDDYAHHPAELKAFFSAVKSLYPEKKLCAVFQPHLFTRTRDFVDDFAAALSLVDELILMPIYPAREKPIEGVTSEWLLKKVMIGNKKILNHEEVLAYVKKEKPELIVTVGAGNIDRLVHPFKEILTNA